MYLIHQRNHAYVLSVHSECTPLSNSLLAQDDEQSIAWVNPDIDNVLVEILVEGKKDALVPPKLAGSEHKILIDLIECFPYIYQQGTRASV